MNDKRYVAALDLCMKEYKQTNNWDTATAKGTDFLISNNIPEYVAVENMNFIIMINVLSKIRR